MNILEKIAEELSIKVTQVNAAVELLDGGATVPFIARYRKEVTGSLNDEQLRELSDRLKYLRGLEDRKAQVISSIEEQGKLTDELKAKIEAAETMVLVEDLYRPYKQKRRTRAMAAKEKGLEPLAEYILAQNATEEVEVEAAKYVKENEDPKLSVTSALDAIAGASDIIAEQVSDDAVNRTWIREATVKEGQIVSAAKDKEAKSVYENYYEYAESLATIPGHRVLAINRGEKEGFLSLKIEAPKERILAYLNTKMITSENLYTTPIIMSAVEDAYDRLIAPAIEREIRSDLTEKAEDGAIHVFGKNLEQLLLQPPIAGQVVLGWDPGFRNGCKLAIVDPTGKVLDTRIVYATQGDKQKEIAKKQVADMIKKFHVTLISCGNGTASRESEAIISDIISENGFDTSYIITNEAGASIYSASKQATEELPDYTEAQRSAISIARRVQDPLAELVKIDPQNIGVGQYQHDCNQKKLDEALTGVVEDSVNKVGIDLNTASASLLEYVSGISKSVAKNIVSYREENGAFTDRKQLLKVSKLGPKAFEQCAGFCRVRDGKNPLDMTSVHPESYKAAEVLLKELGFSAEDLKKGGIPELHKRITDMDAMAEKCGVGVPTLTDIVKELEKPGRDPREDMPKPILSKEVLSMEDLKPGQILKGTVRNVIDFGAFVDIGVHQDGLVHISQMSAQRRVNHPLDVVSVGDIVDVRVISVEPDKERIALSMILDENAAKNRHAAGTFGRGKGRHDGEGSKRRDGKGGKGQNRGGQNQNRGSRNNNKGNAGLDLSRLSKFMH